MNMIKTDGYIPLDDIYYSTGNHERKPAQPYGYLTKELNENAIRNKAVIVKLKKRNKIFNLFDFINNKLNNIQNIKAREYEEVLENSLEKASQKIDMERKQKQMSRIIDHFQNSMFSGMLENIVNDFRKEQIRKQIEQDDTILQEEKRANNLINNGVKLNEIRTENDKRIFNLEVRLRQQEQNLDNLIMESRTKEQLKELEDSAFSLDMRRTTIQNIKDLNKLETIEEEDIDDELLESSITDVNEEVLDNIRDEEIQSSRTKTLEEEMEEEDEKIRELQTGRTKKTEEEKELLSKIRKAREDYLNAYNSIEKGKTDLKDLLKGVKFTKKMPSNEIKQFLNKIKKNYFLKDENLGTINFSNNKAEKVDLLNDWVKELKKGKLYNLEDFIMKTKTNLIKNIDLKVKNLPPFVADTNFRNFNLQKRKDYLNMYNKELSNLLGFKLQQPKALTTTPLGSADIISGEQTKAQTPTVEDTDLVAELEQEKPKKKGSKKKLKQTKK
jgi:hypothetical protein